MSKHDHYYSTQPSSVSAPQTFATVLCGCRLTLTTDHGVFSRGKVDRGSALLATAAEIPPHARVLDLGCGYGVVGICIAKSEPTALVWMVDVNERAVSLAIGNTKQNGVFDRVITLQSDGAAALDPGQRFDVVLLNPPIRAGKETVFRLYREAREVIAQQGRLYVVIQKKQGAESSAAYLQTLFADVSVIAKEQGYRVLCCQVENNR